MKMKKGEVALVTVELEYAFGSNESKQELAVVPPISTMYFEERESWDMNTEEKIEAETKKEEGSSKFKAGKYALASKRYEKVYNNMNCPLICEFYRRAQAYMELADLDLAEFDVKKALEIDPNNSEAEIEKVEGKNEGVQQKRSQVLWKHKESSKDGEAMST
ncbi:PREDICTED: peptidyl-prolyl cis-trans isomerase FKBP62-like isoform X1 [Camelina sativa]|uniref:Peptidyl-prolyl cis-trans isomerase FKBP62-like isoform X1 n=2 Tax=Camelina sativa TaxID=90675 RepID=A0ABM0UFX3_CAMSA|nr:PREDICTED: peptidyl-prolyl cis-trans isomerase FKBP62-like isoform X1 [Camelina sativa]